MRTPSCQEILRLSLVVVLSSLSFASLGCNSLAKAIDSTMDTPEARQTMMTKATSSCIASASKTVSDAGKLTPAAEGKITAYCNCFTQKYIATAPMSEMAKAGISGINAISAEQKTKMNATMQVCQTEAFGDPGKTTAAPAK